MADHTKVIRPPGLAQAILRLSSGIEFRDAMLGDLEEEFAQRAASNAQSARAWYFSQVLSSATPLVQQRVGRSAILSTILIVVLTVLAYVCVNAWDVSVARTAARAVARFFRTAPPIPFARLTYVAAQMFVVGAAALVIATLTFRAENSIVRNTASRLGMLAVVVVAPQFIAMSGPNGYTLDFLIPWAGAMMTAIAAGATLAVRIAGKR